MVAAVGKGALFTGKFDLAIAQYQKALAMEPVVPEFYLFLARAYLSSGRLDEAETAFRKLSDLSPAFPGESHLFETLFVKGDLEAALALSDTSFKLAVTHHALGNTALADAALSDLIERAGPYELALAYGLRGEVDKTFESLQYALDNTDYYPTWILTEVAFQSVYSDPRWQQLMEELGLLEYWLEMKPDVEQ